jgi:hypothetical protein
MDTGGLHRGVSRSAWGEPDSVLQLCTAELQRDGVPLADEFAEMIAVSGSRTLESSPTLAAAELVAEPMTAAESVGTLLLAAIASRARDEQLDDEAILRIIARAAVLVARFETYLAERRSVTRCEHDD